MHCSRISLNTSSALVHSIGGYNVKAIENKTFEPINGQFKIKIMF